MSDETRRAFLGKVSVTAPGLVVLGGAAGVASASESGGERRAIGARAGAPFSRAVAFDQLVYVSGVVGQKPGERGPMSEDFTTQCRQAMENLIGSVEAGGSSLDKVLKCTCFLTDVSDFAAFNKIYMSFFQSNPPARSTVVVKELVVPGAKLEIDCVTCLG